MGISLRSMLIAGVATAAVSAITVAPVHVTPEAHVSSVSAPVQLAAAVAPITPQEVSSALAEFRRLAPKLNLAGAGAVTPAQGAASIQNDVSVQNDVAVQNTASDVVNSVYERILFWTDYLALELAPYLLGWVPFGWLITDQIYALYPPIIEFTDSVVYDLIDPVLNDPLNLEVWRNGISAVAYTAVASLINAGINEVNLVIDYFLGWLPPLPPLPPWPLAAAAPATVAPAVTNLLATSELDEVPPSVEDAPTPLETGADSAAAPAAVVQTGLTPPVEAVSDLSTEPAQPQTPSEATQEVEAALPEPAAEDPAADETATTPETAADEDGDTEAAGIKKARATEKLSRTTSRSHRDAADAGNDRQRTEARESAAKAKADSKKRSASSTAAGR